MIEAVNTRGLSPSPIAIKESRGDYSIINIYGYLGKYQFGKGTLKLIGIKDAKGFISNSYLQEQAFSANTSRNKWILRRDIKRFQGTYIGGIKITESGHLVLKIEKQMLL